MPPRLILTGPTASGKGSVSHELALRLGGEVVVVDSMKVYRGLDAGTAKPSAARRAEVPYHLLDVADPAEDFNAGRFLELCLAAVRDIEARGRRPILAGGTPFYLWALLGGLATGPRADWAVREGLTEEAARLGSEALHRRLLAEDPQAAQRIHPHDLRRIVRALEVRVLTGRPLSEAWKDTAPRLEAGSYLLFGLLWDRKALYRRIDERVLRMVRAGLLDEARRLRERPGGLGRAAAACIGYRQVYEGDARGASEPEVIAAVQQATRRFAKQQLTWFRRFPIEWIPVTEATTPAEAAAAILSRAGTAGPPPSA